MVGRIVELPLALFKFKNKNSFVTVLLPNKFTQNLGEMINIVIHCYCYYNRKNDIYKY